VEWLDEETVGTLLAALPAGNLSPQQASSFVQQVVDGCDQLTPHLEEIARGRADALLQAHTRVRTASRAGGVRYRVEPHLPVDLLGIYVLLPPVQ
jgi:hypothetical protein